MISFRQSIIAGMIALAGLLSCTGTLLAGSNGTTRVALVQLDSANAGNWGVVAARVAEAKQNGAAFVIFPESSYLGWLNPAAFSEAATVPGAVTETLSKIAMDNEVYIAFGLAERGPAVSPGIYLPYDAGVLIGPDGSIVLHSRKHEVLKNAFNPADCPPGTTDPDGGCSYYQAPVSAIPLAETPLGKTAVLVCADAYTYQTAALDHVKALGVQTIIVVWGVTASQESECGTAGFSAVDYASEAAQYSGALVIGANAVGNRPYGRFLPSLYCGYSGIVAADGTVIGSTAGATGVFVYDVPLATAGAD
ncbi:carbon-nitrogen hydrolase family protein [Pelagibius sp. CAU 1746]|uniref:carbon-nitrogen hydrolase family protein n=1 Tax=Pelagibius sp. CAU 1746 TaxID=3140370 RepID=UPI00325AAA31